MNAPYKSLTDCLASTSTAAPAGSPTHQLTNQVHSFTQTKHAYAYTHDSPSSLHHHIPDFQHRNLHFFCMSFTVGSPMCVCESFHKHFLAYKHCVGLINISESPPLSSLTELRRLHGYLLDWSVAIGNNMTCYGLIT